MGVMNGPHCDIVTAGTVTTESGGRSQGRPRSITNWEDWRQLCESVWDDEHADILEIGLRPSSMEALDVSDETTGQAFEQTLRFGPTGTRRVVLRNPVTDSSALVVWTCGHEYIVTRTPLDPSE